MVLFFFLFSLELVLFRWIVLWFLAIIYCKVTRTCVLYQPFKWAKVFLLGLFILAPSISDFQNLSLSKSLNFRLTLLFIWQVLEVLPNFHALQFDFRLLAKFLCLYFKLSVMFLFTTFPFYLAKFTNFELQSETRIYYCLYFNSNADLHCFHQYLMIYLVKNWKIGLFAAFIFIKVKFVFEALFNIWKFIYPVSLKTQGTSKH